MRQLNPDPQDCCLLEHLRNKHPVTITHTNSKIKDFHIVIKELRAITEKKAAQILKWLVSFPMRFTRS